MEHRASPRIDTDLRAELHRANTRTVARIKNISTLGLFLATKTESYRLYESLTVTVGPARGYTLKGRVVRKQDNGIAVELDTSKNNLAQSARLLQAIKHSHTVAATPKTSRLVNE